MPTTVFKKPPLVEIVAEIRWDIPNLPKVPQQLSTAPIPVPNASAHEAHFLNFAGMAGSKGFGLIERIVPPGFPVLAHQVAIRYRSNNKNTEEGSPLFQLGAGIFTANISPPYKSWQHFRPFIDLGTNLLLQSRTQEDMNKEFSSVRLRYIDAFRENLREGKSISQFIRQILGMDFKFPDSVMRFCTNAEDIKPNISASLPIEIGTLNIAIQEAWVRNELALIMDTTVICKGPIPADKEAILAALDSAHQVIHEAFVGMTGPLHQLMVREEVN